MRRMKLVTSLRLGRMQVTHLRNNSIIWPRDPLREEPVAKAARVLPGQLASRPRNKLARCSRGIFVVPGLPRFLSRDLFGQVGLLLPPRKATTQIRRRPSSLAHSVPGALLDLCPTNHALASTTR